MPTATLTGSSATADQVAVRRHNLSLVLGHLRGHGPLSRAQVATEPASTRPRSPASSPTSTHGASSTTADCPRAAGQTRPAGRPPLGQPSSARARVHVGHVGGAGHRPGGRRPLQEARSPSTSRAWARVAPSTQVGEVATTVMSRGRRHGVPLGRRHRRGPRPGRHGRRHPSSTRRTCVGATSRSPTGWPPARRMPLDHIAVDNDANLGAAAELAAMNAGAGATSPTCCLPDRRLRCRWRRDRRRHAGARRPRLRRRDRPHARWTRSGPYGCGPPRLLGDPGRPAAPCSAPGRRHRRPGPRPRARPRPAPARWSGPAPSRTTGARSTRSHQIGTWLGARRRDPGQPAQPERRRARRLLRRAAGMAGSQPTRSQAAGDHVLAPGAGGAGSSVSHARLHRRRPRRRACSRRLRRPPGCCARPDRRPPAQKTTETRPREVRRLTEDEAAADRCAASSRRSPACAPSAASTSRSAPARCTACSARTAPASRR